MRTTIFWLCFLLSLEAWALHGNAVELPNVPPEEFVDNRCTITIRDTIGDVSVTGDFGEVYVNTQNELFCKVVNESSYSLQIWWLHQDPLEYYSSSMYAAGIGNCPGIFQDFPTEETCYIGIRFDPKSIVNETSNFSVIWRFMSGGNQVRSVQHRYYFKGSSTYRLGPEDPVELPEDDDDPDAPPQTGQSTHVEPCNCIKTQSGSIIRVDNLSFGEEVPVVGTSVSLVYSSELSVGYEVPYINRTKYASFNPEGWMVSLVHSYDLSQQRLFHGTGRSFVKPYIDLNSTEIMVPDSGEVYVFSKVNGRHLRTLTFLTGVTRYLFTYDTSGYLTKISDLYGNETHFVRRIDNTLKEVIPPLGLATNIQVDSQGRINRIINPAGEVHSIIYKAGTDLISEFKFPSGAATAVTYDAKGRLKSTRKAGTGYDFSIVGDEERDGNYIVQRSTEGVMSRFRSYRQFSGNTYVRWEKGPTGEVSSYHEDLDGSATTQLRDSWVTSFTDNDVRFGAALPRQDYLVETERAIERTTRISQDLIGGGTSPFSYTSLTEEVSINGMVHSAYFNWATKTMTMTSAEGIESGYKLDANERIIASWHGTDEPIDITYNSRGKIHRIERGARTISELQYDGSGNISSISKSGYGTSSFLYDLAGRVTLTTMPNGQSIFYQYNSDGLLSSITPAGKPAHWLFYNAWGGVSGYRPPVISGVDASISYQYDRDKRIRSILKPSYSELSFVYAVNGTLASIRTPEKSQKYEYYPSSSQVKKVTSFDGVESSYEYAGRLLAGITQRVVFGVEIVSKVLYTYDNFFRPSKKTISASYLPQDIVIKTTYDKDGRPLQNGEISYTYDGVSGRATTAAIGNVHDQWGYNSFGEISSYQSSFVLGSPIPMYSYTLERDLAGRITQKTETVLQKTNVYNYVYDSAGRLSTVRKNGIVISQYEYDGNGNRLSGINEGMAFTATYDDQDRILTYNGKQYLHNNSGDVVGIQEPILSRPHSYSYGPLGKMKSYVQANGKQGELLENAQGQTVRWMRNGASLRYDMYEGVRLVGTFDEVARTSQFYVHGEYVLTPSYMTYKGRAYRFITDHLGSPRLIVDVENGKILQEIEYDVWGKVLRDTNVGVQPFSFAGGIVNHDTGFVRFGARDYDPETGRWTSKDPILFSGGDTNLYGYVNSDPINGIDPSGLKTRILITRNALGFGNHVALQVDNGGSPILYDPGGSFGGAKSGTGAFDGGAAVSAGNDKHRSPPETGRWTSKDPILFSGGDVNLYGYVLQDPINLYDPSGTDVWIEGANEKEPMGHWSVNVGEPDGDYKSYSFAYDFDLGRPLGGHVYPDVELGGNILRYKITTSSVDREMIRQLDAEVGRQGNYLKEGTCRGFSENVFNSTPGVEVPYRGKRSNGK
ncbi:hypothetical protein EZJ49_09215 [Bdellovibrio bacteriovorus]|uniref:RHS repeat protein n=1 Tax=Bdellovibrio bacteriovorus TaxID=959 RepID=UPI0021D112CC|nr:RHS repeat-associated core domain-containing protein [Bdellovibrio bacteriovorus]UXR63257.1 hypothetical protein EZJ49_09215 [Bdellovibrio bacteriovorus]